MIRTFICSLSIEICFKAFHNACLYQAIAQEFVALSSCTEIFSELCLKSILKAFRIPQGSIRRLVGLKYFLVHSGYIHHAELARRNELVHFMSAGDPIRPK